MTHGKELKNQLVRGALGVGGVKLLSLPITLAASILLARGLGPEGYGQYAFIMSLVALLALPIGPGLGQLITREVAKYHHGGDWSLFRGLLRRAHQLVLGGSIFVMMAVGFLLGSQPQWRSDDRWTLLLIAVFMVPLLGLSSVRSSTLRGLRHVFYAQLPELLARPGLHLVIAGALLAVGMLNPLTALFSQILATAGAYLLGAWILRRRRPAELSDVLPDYRHGEWGRALLPFTLLAAVGTVNGQIGVLVLGFLGGDPDVAALRVAMSGAMLVATSLAIVNMVIGPHITHAQQNNDKARLQRLSRQSARAALIVALPIALPLILFGATLIRLVFGEAYVEMAVWPLAILAAAQLVNVAFGSVGLFLTMSGYERDTLLGQVIALIMNALVAVILVPVFGAVGAALSVAIGLLTWNGILAARFVQRLGFRPTAFL